MNRAITQTLCEVAEIIMGQSPESESYNDRGDGIPFYQGKSDFGEVYPTVRMYCTSPKKIAMADDIIMSVRAPIGDVNIAQEKCCIGRGLAAIRPKGTTNLKYLFYLLDYYKERLAKQGTGSTFKAISKDVLNEFHIPIWPVEKQKWVADVIDEIQTIIFNRKKTLFVLDELVKSRFVEMFGDPVTNPMGWKKMIVDDVCQSIVDCPHSTPHYTNEDTGYMCIRTSIVKKNCIMWDEVEYISKEEFEERIQRKKPERGDIVYTREGAILGIAAIIDRDCNVALGQRSMLLSPNQGICNSVFLSCVMNFDSFFHRVTDGVTGSASPHINVKDIKAFEIPLPPIELQNQFADFVTLTDKSKLAVQRSIETLQTLKAKLMQDYFG